MKKLKYWSVEHHITYAIALKQSTVTADSHSIKVTSEVDGAGNVNMTAEDEVVNVVMAQPDKKAENIEKGTLVWV